MGGSRVLWSALGSSCTFPLHLVVTVYKADVIKLSFWARVEDLACRSGSKQQLSLALLAVLIYVPFTISPSPHLAGVELSCSDLEMALRASLVATMETCEIKKDKTGVSLPRTVVL